ncbi:MAG: hypothetical protein V2J07_01165 [Anaerolineae bacterium]|jgi:hypothetical protein|nr:hypothetical protein [Anaerolineae bacterium]
MKNPINLYKEFYIDRDYELVAMFRLLNECFEIKKVLYPGCYVHIAPSFIFPEVTYVDSFKKAQPFFDDTAVAQYIQQRKEYDQEARVNFLLKDYQKDLELEPASFDLLISLYAGLISPACKQYVKPGGLILVNNSHGDASIAALDTELSFIGAITQKSGKYTLREDKLEEYFIPKKPDTFTEAHIRQTGKGIGFTKTAFMYLFRK